MRVREITAGDTYDLRGRVLRPGQPAEALVYPSDQAGTHLGAFDGPRLISIVSTGPEDSPLFAVPGGWRIRGMATDPEYQGKGPGTVLLRALLARGREKNIPFFWCNARQGAFAFYERQGFTFESELFEIAGIGPHKVMRVIL